MIPSLALLLFASVPLAEKGEVSVYSVFANPEKYYFGEVEFTGFFSARSAQYRFIWPTREDFISGDSFRCLEVRGKLPAFQMLGTQPWNLTYIRIRATLRPNLNPDSHCALGELVDVKSIEVSIQNIERSWKVPEGLREEVLGAAEESGGE